MAKSTKPCPRCRSLRAAVLAVVLGAGAGYAVLAYGGSREWSMLATFFGAVLPVMWWARKGRDDANDRSG